jgi:hypothetical protein
MTSGSPPSRADLQLRGGLDVGLRRISVGAGYSGDGLFAEPIAVAQPSTFTPPPKRGTVLPMCPVPSVTYVSGRSRFPEDRHLPIVNGRHVGAGS